MAHHQRQLSNGGHLKKALPSHGKGLKPAPQPKKGAVQKSGKNAPVKDESDEEMAASFLPYCTYCEKQIMTPVNSVLYCSESCKRKDRDQKTVYSVEQHSPPLTPYTRTFSFEDLPNVPDIVPKRSPTSANMSQNRYSFSSLSDEDHPHSSEEDRRPQLPLQHSEASRYLRQFHYTNGMTTIDEAKPSRPRLHRAAQSQNAISIAPSLSHTPASYMTSGMSMPYTPQSINTANYFSNAHPLPSRHHPHSAASYGAKSIGLVTPFTTMTAPETTSQRILGLKTSPTTATSSHTWVEGEMMQYEKKSLDMIRERSLSASASASKGSLKKLFAFEEMSAPPSRSEL
ncbi:hypothetical protein NA57DRAFT_74214 [Rhizodiscina lignyota]|uniref:Life-span regulatory factor domain-containing protein n=1 Tax=Rhizodiscina lignyota TaxID=1504668 RepID=A0A9P4IJ75_9PEZI|nr:hypothetical protein NA57DRAFT_74214 [Rhizodiscina lignyota]